MENVSFKRIVGKKGLTPSVSFPPEILDYLDIQIGDHVNMMPMKVDKTKSVLISKVENGTN